MIEMIQSCTCCGEVVNHSYSGGCGCEERRKKGQYCKNCEHCTKHCGCPKKDAKLCVWEIFVPTMIGDKPVRARYHRVWDEKVRKLTQGLTVYHPAKGQWVEDGEVFKERMIPVRVACTKSLIETIADFTITYYKQKAVMYYLVTDKVFIRKAKN